MSKDHTFVCTGCRQVKDMGPYAVAQLASGKSLEYTCLCGAQTKLRPSMLPPKESHDAR